MPVPKYWGTAVLAQTLQGMPMARPLRSDMLTLRVTAIAVIDDEARREVALSLIENAARDLQLKLLLLADGLPSVDVEWRLGNDTLRIVPISSETLPEWVEEQST